MTFNSGLTINLRSNELGFDYGTGVVGPEPEFRSLDAIRPSLRDPECDGPDPVYGIAMDVARAEDIGALQSRMLLFGVVAYAEGRLGDEPVRSQGHVHALSLHNGWSAPEWFEIWQGKAIIYAQQSVEDNPGFCIAVSAEPGEQVVVPPGWAHCVINADPTQKMVFGALCDRQYGFEYGGVRSHGGLAWFPVLGKGNGLEWERNPRYGPSTLSQRGARTYPELGCVPGLSMYDQFRKYPESVQWVSDPKRFEKLWHKFRP